MKINLHGYRYDEKVFIFNFHNAAAAGGDSLLVLGLPPSYETFATKKGLGSKEDTQKLQSCPTLRTIMKLIKMEG